MGEEAVSDDRLGEAERLAVLYAPRPLRRRYRSVFGLDAQLARIVLTAREPTLAQLKLAWWRDACDDLDQARGAPLVLELARSGETAALIGLVDGWEEVAAGEDDYPNRAERLAEARAMVFAAVAGVQDLDPCRNAARRWTLVTLAATAAQPSQRLVMLETAQALPQRRLPRSLRPLALLDGLARRAGARQTGGSLLGDRFSPLAALRLGIFGR